MIIQTACMNVGGWVSPSSSKYLSSGATVGDLIILHFRTTQLLVQDSPLLTTNLPYSVFINRLKNVIILFLSRTIVLAGTYYFTNVSTNLLIFSHSVLNFREMYRNASTKKNLSLKYTSNTSQI
jgi:hypothetical protein